MFRASGSNIASEALSGNGSTDNEMYIDEAVILPLPQVLQSVILK